MSVSVLILTLNEERNLHNCLPSLGWCDDIVILDSYSTDRTVQIAQKAGARVYQRRFDDYAGQRNYGLSGIRYKYPWVLMVDADEVVPADLADEIKTVLAGTDEYTTLYRMRRRDFFMGKWIRRSSGYPVWFGRLIKTGSVRVDRAVNEEYHTDGKAGSLRGHLEHFPFNKGIAAWIEKHNRYSSMEAELLCNKRPVSIRREDLLSRDPVLRRRATKALFYRLPGRPLLLFLALYLFRGGFLDGRPGLSFCLLRAYYEFMINCKVMEHRRQGHELQPQSITGSADQRPVDHPADIQKADMDMRINK